MYQTAKFSLGHLEIFVRGMYGSIAALNGKHAIVFVVTSFGVGQLLNGAAPMERFLVYQLLFIPAIIIALTEIKIFVRSVERYRTTVASHPTRETGSYITGLLRSYWALPGLLTISALYLYSTVSLKFVQLNLTGIYALLLIVLVMFSAVLAQTCYVYYLLLLRRVFHSESFKYNFYFPARTNWVQLLAQIGTRLSNAFFLLGFIYTTVFYLNVPSGYVTISRNPWRLEISTPNDTAFVVCWITIFVIIILAFPVYAYLQSRYLRKIIRKLKDLSIGEIEMAMTHSNFRGSGNFDTELKCYQLMASIENSGNTTSDSTNVLPMALTLSSIAVHLIKITESFSP